MNNKRGITSIIICIFSVLIIFVLLVSVIIYISINTLNNRVKQDISYIVTNGINSYDMELLSLENYKVDMIQFKENIQNLLDKNYQNKNGLIKEINVKEIEFIYEKEKIENSLFKVPYVHIKLSAKINKISSIINKEHELIIEDKIKLSLLKY